MNKREKQTNEVPPEVLQQAAEWFVHLRTEDPSFEECSTWITWIEADPIHRAAFARIQQCWDISGVPTSPVWPTAEEIALAADGPTARGIARTVRRLALSALAAGIAIAVTFFGLNPDGLVSSVRQRLGGERISTERGEAQLALLADGSRIELGGLTDIAVRFTDAQRLIVAGEGEAYYHVAHDPTRPFVVQSGPVRVTARGTAFLVRREGASVSISVSEGVVDVESAAPSPFATPTSPLRARAGERLRIEQGAVVAASEHARVVGWRPGRLSFEDEPLRVVVAAVNRYLAKPIQLTDAEIGELHFTGTVFPTDIEHWLQSIELVFPVHVRKESGGIQIYRAPKPEEVADSRD